MFIFCSNKWNFMGKMTKSSTKSHKQKSVYKVEMVIRSRSTHAMMRHEVMAHRRSFLFNIPSEDIAVRYSIIERKNQSKMTTEEKIGS